MGAMVKKIALRLVGLASLIAAPAMAAHMPVKYVAPPPVFSWTGCYIGVHVGAGWQVSDFVGGNAESGVGAVGGAQAGSNAQWRQFAIGHEDELWASGLDDRSLYQNQSFTGDTIARKR